MKINSNGCPKEVLILDKQKTYSDFGLNKKQGDYVMYRMCNYNKRKAYSKAFGVEDLDECTSQVWKMEQKVGDKLNAYMKYLAEIKQDEFLMSLEQLREFWVDVATDEKVGMRERVRASELYGKSIGAFIEKVDVNAKVEQVVFTDENDIKE